MGVSSDSYRAVLPRPTRSILWMFRMDLAFWAIWFQVRQDFCLDKIGTPGVACF